MLSNRLQTIYEMMPKANRLIDVGCDHALLDIYAVKYEKVKKALAIDINDKRLQVAVNNIKKYRAKNILLLKNNGLTDVKINKSDVVVISGLGAKTISKIVKEAEPIKNLIIQSNKDLFDVRFNLLRYGYYINNEEVVLDKGIYYVVIHFKRGFKLYSVTDLFIGPIIKQNNKEYIQSLIKKNDLVYKKIPNFNFIRKGRYLIIKLLLEKAYKKYFLNK